MIKKIELYTNKKDLLKKFDKSIKFIENEKFSLFNGFWLYEKELYRFRFMVELIFNSQNYKDCNLYINFCYKYNHYDEKNSLINNNLEKMELENLIYYNRKKNYLYISDGYIDKKLKKKKEFRFDGKIDIKIIYKKKIDFIFDYIYYILSNPLSMRENLVITFLDKFNNKKFYLIFNSYHYNYIYIKDYYNLYIGNKKNFVKVIYNSFDGELQKYITNTTLKLNHSVIYSHIQKFINTFTKNPFDNFYNPIENLYLIELL